MPIVAATAADGADVRRLLDAYWFTASTSFANPAVTVARSLTNTFAGIRPLDAPGFIAAQLVGAATAAVTDRWLNRQPEA
jgi:glycerol uptake facilitator-like aquaporin